MFLLVLCTAAYTESYKLISGKSSLQNVQSIIPCKFLYTLLPQHIIQFSLSLSHSHPVSRHFRKYVLNKFTPVLQN